MTYLIRKHFWVIFAILLFFWPKIVLATNAPTLVSPPDNSNEDKSPKLVWEFNGECITDGSCFRVEVDNSADFSSPDKYVYTNSFSYSPKGLSDGSWHWRVKAKESADAWTAWSQVFKFIIGNTSSPSVQQVTSNSPVPSSKIDNIFSLKDAPSEVNSDQEFEVTVSLVLPDKANTSFFLKGAFKKADSSNYFGEILVANSWVKNNSTYSNQYKIQTDGEGRWEGKIKVKADVEDSGFEGSGDYIFRIGRYTETGGGPNWSNDHRIKINEIDRPEPSPSEEVEDEEFEEEDSDPELVVAAPSREYEIMIASVAGEATTSHNIPLEEHVRVLEERKVNWLLIILGSGVFAGGGGYALYKLKYGKN